MNGQSLLTLVGTLGLPAVMAAIVSFFGVRAQLRSAQPKSDAEADLARAQARERDLEAQGGIVARLSTENKRLDGANTVLSQRLDDYKERLDKLEEKFDVATENNQTLKRQNAILIEGQSRASAWMRRYYDAGHPQGMEPPPVLQNFEKEG